MPQSHLSGTAVAADADIRRHESLVGRVLDLRSLTGQSRLLDHYISLTFAPMATDDVSVRMTHISVLPLSLSLCPANAFKSVA